MVDYRAIVSDPNNLYEALLKSIKGSQWKESSQRASLSFLDLVYDLSDDLWNQTYQSGKEWKFILHERGRVRPITSLTVRDRVVRHVVCDKIFTPLIRPSIIYDNSASLEGRGLSFAKHRFDIHLHKYCAEYGSNEGYILFGDFSKFYDNILHEQAKDMLLELVDYDDYMRWLLDLIFERFVIDCSEMSDDEYYNVRDGVFNRLDYEPPTHRHGERVVEKSINIGDQLAQLIGIYYLHLIDNYIKIICGEPYYARYMDDWYIISPSKERLFELLDAIQQQSEELGLFVNVAKTRIVPLNKKFSYLQTTYWVDAHGHITKQINSKRITAMRIRLKKLAEKYYQGDIPYEDVESMFRSWMGSFHALMSNEQIQQLCDLYESLFDCKIDIHKHLSIERI